MKRLLRRVLRRLGYEVLKVPPPHRGTRPPEPPPVSPVWPLPRNGEPWNDGAIRAAFARHPYWHYAYEFQGGPSLRTSHRNPGLDTDDPRRPLQRFRHFMPYLVQSQGGTLKGKRVLTSRAIPGSGRSSVLCSERRSSDSMRVLS